MISLYFNNKKPVNFLGLTGFNFNTENNSILQLLYYFGQELLY